MGPGSAQDIVGYCINSGVPTISQKYRKAVRSQIEQEKKSKKKTSTMLIGRLFGQAGYIHSAHPAEAIKLKEEIQALEFKTNRRVITVKDVVQTVKTPTKTSTRKVSA
jgi:hypothetical protein